ncbi:tyrosine-type recombinase/integrase [Calothrix sp. PCC 6303]|uniref:tyrosine-type recombinase/integrase n=1 Tax=Calothrix sp. PCC 6303 TaxID=1170562 RepID=UPI0030D879ED
MSIFLDKRELNKTTYNSYISTLMPLLQQYGKHSPQSINRDTIIKYLQNIPNISNSTRNRHQAVIQAVFNFGVEQGYLDYNPISRLKRCKVVKTQESEITAEQMTQLCQFVEKDLRMSALIRLIYSTKLKIGEILALNLVDVDLENQRILVRKQDWNHYDVETATYLRNYITFSRHPQSHALFTAKHPSTAKVTRLTYRRVHRCWVDITSQSSLLVGLHLTSLW